MGVGMDVCLEMVKKEGILLYCVTNLVGLGRSHEVLELGFE